MGSWYLVFNAGNYTGDWHPSAGPSSSLQIENDTAGGGSEDDQWGVIALLNGFADLYLDGNPDPTPFEDLPEDFGIDAFDFWQSPPWITTSLTPIIPNNPVDLDFATAIGGGVGKYYWFIFPLGLYDFQGYGGYVVTNNPPLGDPYLLDSIPPVLTKWNGLLGPFLANGYTVFAFQPSDVVFSTFWTLLVNLNGWNVDGPVGWVMHGTYGSYPPPPNPSIAPMMSGLEFGGSATVQILTDASGIYTLTPGLFRDELWQRVGTVATTTSFAIPQPFFKTGYIGDK